MLLLLTIALVLIGAVALVIGFVSGDQLPIFISIACSVLAGIVLVFFSRMSRTQAAPAGAPAATEPEPAPEPAVVGEEEPLEEEAPELATVASDDGNGGWSGDGEFPIEDYDELLVSEILPLLPELDADELEMVREREQSGKARATLLRRIDQLNEEMEAGDGAAVTTAARPRSEVRAPADDTFADDFDDEEPDEEEEEEAEPEDLTQPLSAVGGGSDDEDDLMFPIEDYDDLRVSEILPLLPELYDDELELVAERERDGQNRATILSKIDELLGEEAPPPPPARTPARATTKKAVAKKAPAKRTPAKKAAAKKAAPKKAAAKKTAAKKTAAKRR